jgi:hypothetical protein
MGILAIVLGGFITALLLSAFSRVHPAAWGCLLPVAASGVMVVLVAFMPSGSTDAVAVPFVFVGVAIGSIAGAFVGGWMRSHNGELL